MKINIDTDSFLAGDLYFRLKHRGKIKNNLICRFALNTSFLVGK